MLLISPYVLAGSVNEGYFNHFSFLRSVEELFGLTTRSATPPNRRSSPSTKRSTTTANPEPAGP